MQTKTKFLCLSSIFTALIAIGAFVRIPIPPYPVPMTLQTFFVFFSGLLLPPKASFVCVAAYVLLGLMGVPIFTNGGGPGYVFDPTFGYLLAFLFAAPAIGVAARRYRGWRFALAGLGILIGLELLGVLYMALVSGVYLGTPIPLSRAWYVFYIFLPLDALKFYLCVPVAKAVRARLPHDFFKPHGAA